MQADLSKKDEQFREFSLNGPMWRVVLYVGFPLALYESLNQLFKILDTMMASHIGRIRGVRGRVFVPDQHDDLGGGNRACGGRQHQGEPGIWGRRFHAGKKACQHNVCHVRGARYRNTACPGAVHAGVPAPDEYTGRIYCGREHVFQAGAVRNDHHVFQ